MWKWILKSGIPHTGSYCLKKKRMMNKKGSWQGGEGKRSDHSQLEALILMPESWRQFPAVAFQKP